MESLPLPEWLQAYDAQMVILMGAGAMILLLIFIWLLGRLFRSGKKSKGIAVQSFQLAPLGRDAFLKITNPGDEVTLLFAHVIGRADVVIKNEVGGQKIPAAGSYSILLEAAGEQRLSKDFSVQFTFVDDQKQTYHQTFSLDPIQSVSLKRKKR
ncbi:MAG: hypothetical protein AAGJ93_01395 [Bacteroidota bacterium]